MTGDLPDDWKVPDIIRTRLGDRPGKQRAMMAEGHMLLVLHELPRPHQVQRRAIFFWRNPQGHWNTTGPHRDELALKTHLQTYQQFLDQLETQYDQAQQASDYFHILEAISPICRAVRNLHGALQSARDQLPDARELISLRDNAADLERESELLQINAKHALDYKIAKQGEELARVSHDLTKIAHRLNLMAGLFLPAMTFATIFGMNLPSGLEKSSPLLFWIVLGVNLAIGLAVVRLLSRRSCPEPDIGNAEGHHR